MLIRILFSFLLLTLFSCGDPSSTDENIIIDEPDEELSFEERAKRYIENQLSITGNEKYSMKIYMEHLDEDLAIDGIITVNRLEYAINEAQQSGKLQKHAEMGFIGRHNFIFYYDGGLDKISPPIPIPSSPHYELKVDFLPLLSNRKKDIAIDYRIKNAQFREFFSVFDHSPKTVFQWNVFKDLGEDSAEASYFIYDQGTLSNARDILIYKGKMEAVDPNQDLNLVEPKIEPGTELLYRFFYNPKDQKYYTQKSKK